MKSIVEVDIQVMNNVAPFAGAWIEIANKSDAEERSSSLPSRERGLKYSYCKSFISAKQSLPSRERGLKSKGSEVVCHGY